MKKAIAILFLFIFMASTTHLYELVKLPEFMKHFALHKKEDANISFWKFVAIHYFNGDEKDADYAQDIKLPFKANDQTCASIVLDTPVPVFNLKPVVFNVIKKFNITHTHFHNLLYSSVIWQPPKA